MDNGERDALIKEIVTQIRNDALKQDALSSALGKGGWREAIPKFFKHPAVLLIIGFAITGLIGGWIANRWQRKEWDRQQPIQSKEWERQQLRLIDIHGINLRYKIIDEITKTVGERNAAAKGILSPLEQEQLNDQQLIQAEKEPKLSWEKVSHDWRVNSQILKLQIATYVKAQDAATIWDEIIETEKKIGSRVVIVKNDPTKYKQASSESDEQRYLDSIINDVAKTEEALKRLVSVIAAEARREIEGSRN